MTINFLRLGGVKFISIVVLMNTHTIIALMNESFRKLAILYFEGRITPNQECELFGFIAAAPENALQVRKWESEWKRQHIPSTNVLHSLAMFNAKVEHRDNRLRTRHRWLRFSAAAVVLTFLYSFPSNKTSRLRAVFHG